MLINSKTSSIKKAVLINFIGKYSNIIVQLIFSSVLARILTPKDFGVVAVVTVFTSFFSLIADMGIGPGIIQNKNIDQTDNENIFSFTFYIGIVIGLLFAAFSFPLSILYADKVYLSIGALLSLPIFFNTINIVPNALLLKDHQFKLVNIRLVIVSVLTAIPTVILALSGFKYYSIIIQSILSSAFTFAWNYHSVKLRLHWKPSGRSLNKIRHFSAYQFMFGIINYFSRNMDNILIGKFMGSTSLGFYDKSYKLMLYPVQNLTHVITPVLHPILSVYQDNREYIYDKFMRVIKILSLLGVFFTAYSFFAAKEIVLILYGNQWYSSITSFQFLSLSIWAQMITSSTGTFYQSLGKTRTLFASGFASAILLLSSIFIGIYYKNINIVAAFVSAALNINFILTTYILVRNGFEKSAKDFFSKIMPDFLMLIFILAVAFILNKIDFQNLFISSIYKLIVVIVAFLFALLLTNQIRILKYLRKATRFK